MGLFDGVKNTFRKSEAAVVVQNFLEHAKKDASFRRDPASYANELVQKLWGHRPEVFDGKNAQKPHKVSTAAISLALGIRLLDETDADRDAVILSLGNLLNIVAGNNAEYRDVFHAIDFELLESAYTVLEQVTSNIDDVPFL